MSALISVDQFRRQARGKPHPKVPAETRLFRAQTSEVKAVEGRPRTFRFCFSDGSVDRMNDTIDPAGWNLSDFEKNPVALWAHDSTSPPIGRASGVGIEGDRLMGDIEFMPADVYPFAETIYRMVAGGWLNAVSVGFLPRDYDWSDDDDREWGMDFRSQDLLEISIVPVPALATALIDARAKGVDTRPIVEWAERALDGGGKVIVPKTELERLRKAAKEPTMTKRVSPRRRDGMSETDPASGGAAVGNCGRPAESECGMKDPVECSIHGFGGAGADDRDDAMDEKSLAKLIRREIGAAMKAFRKDAEDHDDPSDADAPDEPITKAFAHMKAAHVYHKMAMGAHKKALDLLDDVVNNSEDTDDEGDDGAGRSSDDRADRDDEKAALLAQIKQLRDV